MGRSIVLYTLIPEAEEGTRLPIGAATRARWRLGSAVDWLRWRHGGRFGFKSYRFERFLCSNLGDMAVRRAVAEEIARRAAPGVEVRQVRWGSLTPALVEDINRSADLMVIAGGGYLSADREGRLIARCRRDIALFERLTVPLVSFGIGLNVNLEDREQAEELRLSQEARAALGAFARRHSLLGVRDRFTQSALAEASGRPIALAPDPVFFLDPGPDLRIAARRGKVGKPTIGVNLAFHGRHPEIGLARNFARYVAILKRLRQHTGCRFVYFQHSDAERLVFRLLEAEGLVEDCHGADGPAATLAAYGEVDLVIGEMMHAAIMALSAGTPVVSIGYDVKHRSLFELLDLRDWLVDPLVEPLEDLEARALQILADPGAAGARLLRAVGRLEAPYEAFSKEVGDVMEQLRLTSAAARPEPGEALRA